MLGTILKKELKIRIRNKKSSLYMSIYLIILFITLIFSFIHLEDFDYNKYSFNPRTAVEVYNVLIFVQFVLISIIIVNLSGGIIKEEFENYTFDILISTEISNQTIIIGKLLSILVYIIVLYFVSLPIVVTIFLLGGISIINTFFVIIFSLTVSLLLSSLSILYSVVLKNKIGAIIFSNITMTVFIFGSVITDIFSRIQIVKKINYVLLSISPLNALNEVLDTSFLIGKTNVNISFLPCFMKEYWIYYSIIYIAVSLILIFMSSKLIRKQVLR